MTAFIRQLVCGGWILFFALPLQAKQALFFVDPDFSGAGTGAANAPWRSLDPPAWVKINTELASGDVTVFFSARAADSDVHQTTSVQLQLRRTDTSSNRLTLDGMSRYNANDTTPSWLGYLGTSRFTINYAGWDAITGTTNAPYLASYITLRGFRAFSTDGKPINIWGGNNVIVEFNEAAHSGFTGDGAGLQIQYARKSGNTEVPCRRDESHNCGVSNVTIRNNVIHNTQGEGIYIGGVENQDFPAHSNITIENNTIYDVGMGAEGEGDAIDIKDGTSSVTVRANRIYMTVQGKGRDGIVTMSGGLIEGNSIANMGRAGIVLSVTWNRYPTRKGTIVRNNVIAGCGGSRTYMWSHGIAVSGSSQNDQWNDVEISSNAIINIRAALAGDGRGIEISRYAQRPVVENNLIYNTAGENLVFESRAANRD